MPHSLRRILLSLREWIASSIPLVVAAIALLWLAYWWLDPVPPKTLRLATGPAQSAYAEFGQRYTQALRANGIEVELVSSEGAADNWAKLQAGDVDAAFIQGGSNQRSEDDSALLSLGNLFNEPIWVFYRQSAVRDAQGQTVRLQQVAQLRKLHINIPPQGSGAPYLLGQLLDLNRMDPAHLHISHLDQTPATVELLNQRLDAVVFVSAPEAPIVQMLLQTPGIGLMDFPQQEAYARRLGFITPATLPNGVVDIAKRMPRQDVRLLATTTSLLVREDVHPALRQLLAQAAVGIHGQSGWFNRAHEFPNGNTSEYPLASEAERTYKNGTPWLQRYLPFGVANLIERMWLALGIIVAVLIPLGKIAPPLYAFRVRSRVFRWYAQLRHIEEQLSSASAEQRQALLAELDALERRVEKIILPLSYTDELYNLRHHMELVRQRLLKA
ncbi:C4-dicarboxylate ABC transporter substrate-binding protein [Curvibacter sp. CHRR-16]|uniref:TAXI family TRAP transporter solute-binding subunit n=1 Tax=Curvibacter sp. CHRR-16 TaxID=2835872 RepID=UPI001BDA530A|nr:TAXI family TRAP transporter solute-binding subunit [Curvibacter sp. CHRR-16]MBT0571697.1 C4-dicarboxylate ABC transporter substrate-binding protein [Curvibacter sp. CHRR-16]